MSSLSSSSSSSLLLTSYLSLTVVVLWSDKNREIVLELERWCCGCFLKKWWNWEWCYWVVLRVHVVSHGTLWATLLPSVGDVFLWSGVIWLRNCQCVIWCFMVCRESLSECKKQNNSLLERVQSLQTELSDCEIRCSELDGQMKHTHNVCCFAVYFMLLFNLFSHQIHQWTYWIHVSVCCVQCFDNHLTYMSVHVHGVP